jgi:ribosomal protein S14
MTILRQINRDKVIRQRAFKAEFMVRSYKYLLNNKQVDRNKRFLLSFIFVTKNISKYFRTKVRNYCVITKNPRWVFRRLHLSRQQLKKSMTKGNLMGMRKAC